MKVIYSFFFFRYYTLQRTEGDGPWLPVQGRVDPELTSFTVGNLKPYTSYRFRIQATNDLGPSGWSQESVPARTFPASPNRPITGLRVVPITTTSVRVTWQRIDQSYWNGDYQTAGYRVLFQPVSDFPSALQVYIYFILFLLIFSNSMKMCLT